MKTEFWLIAVVLIIIGLSIVIPPLWKKREVEASDVDQQNIDIARQKLSDLKSQLDSGRIDQTQYELQANELEMALNDDLNLTQNSSAPKKQGRWIIGILVVLLPVVAVSLYQMLGDSSPKALKMPEAPEKIAAKAQVQAQAKAKVAGKAQIGSVDDMVAGLAERLKNQPDDLQGWVMLGKSYKFIKQFDKAAEAFSKANILAGTDPEIMLQYADSLAMVNQGRFTGEAKRLIFKALELDSENATGLWLAGKVKVEEGDYVAALKYLRILQPQIEQGSQHYRELETFIANVQSQIEGGKANTVTSASSNVTNNGSNEDNIVRLEMRLKNNPDDLQGWADLGNAYKQLKQYDKAISAFEKSKALSGSQADVMLMYADALVMRDNGQYSEQAKALIFKALELKPDDTTALWLGGKTRVQEGKYNEALQYLRKAETHLQSGSQSHNIMLGYIAYVESLIASSTATSAAVPAVSTKMPEANNMQASGEARIQVKVTLSAELQNQTTANDTVFIYAKAMSGPQMPLAIVRKKVSDLPVTVWLTDAQAMTPMMKLSKFNNVKLTARISKSGNAMTQPGDIIGVVDSISVTGQQVINININRVIN